MKKQYVAFAGLVGALTIGTGFTLLAQTPTPKPITKADQLKNNSSSMKLETRKPGDLKPLSAADKARVEELLKSFDPNSYDIRFKSADAKGGITTVKRGNARGLADIRQTKTERGPGDLKNAGTNNTVNVFKQAGDNNTINVFKQAASTTNTVNVFKDAIQKSKAEELNSILLKYSL